MTFAESIRRLRSSHSRRRFIVVGAERWRRRALFIVGGVGVGCFAALLARLADSAQRQFVDWTQALPWLPWALTPLGFALCTYAARRWFKNSQGSGIPQTIVALRETDIDIRSKLISLRVAAGKLLLTVAGLLCGASTGREGPTVQVGAAIMYAAGRHALRLRGGLIVAGGAAGIAAAFNAPLAGIMFGIEEMSRSFERHTSALVIATVIAAGLTAQALLGNYSYFGSANGMIARQTAPPARTSPTTAASSSADRLAVPSRKTSSSASSPLNVNGRAKACLRRDSPIQNSFWRSKTRNNMGGQ